MGTRNSMQAATKRQHAQKTRADLLSRRTMSDATTDTNNTHLKQNNNRNKCNKEGQRKNTSVISHHRETTTLQPRGRFRGHQRLGWPATATYIECSGV